eukprot:11425084-Alexandrium_andersonii.AAC.1
MGLQVGGCLPAELAQGSAQLGPKLGGARKAPRQSGDEGGRPPCRDWAAGGSPDRPHHPQAREE